MLPKSLHWLAPLSPAYHLDQLALACMGLPAEGSTLVHVLVLAAVSIVFSLLAVRRLARKG